MEYKDIENRLDSMNNDICSVAAACSDVAKFVENTDATLQQLVEIVKSCSEKLEECYQYMYVQQLAINNTRYEILDPLAKKDDKSIYYPKFRSNEETIRLIVEEKKSLARFGDGEFEIAVMNNRQKFQLADEELARRIKEVLKSDEENLLIGIAKNYGELSVHGDRAANAIREYMSTKVRLNHRKLLDLDKVYTDAYISRPYVLYNDADTDGPKYRFEQLKRIWNGKRITIVEGCQTRFGVGNDLLSNAASIKRILGPATNSYSKYDSLLAECLNQAKDCDLFLLAIGPSAGVLAYDLTKQNIQAVDVGHMDLEYEWFLAGKGERVAVPQKYNNEIQGGDNVSDVNDDLYESQIVARYI